MLKRCCSLLASLPSAARQPLSASAHGVCSQRHASRTNSRGKAPSLRYSWSSVRCMSSHRVFVALGSNVGDRLGNIEAACTALDAHARIRVRRTSSLWQTKAMYMVDQADFLNGVCELETSLEPLPLLDELQRIEVALGRRTKADHGPRTLDLDVLLYDRALIRTARLTVPHALMLEREFVLRPLSQLIPHDCPPTGEDASYTEILAALPPSDPPLSTVTPLSPGAPPLTPLSPARRTQLMSIMNMTPDSFSDGGVLPALAPRDLAAAAAAHVSAGAAIIDVGGQSTRPFAAAVSAEEELSRVLPMIEAIRTLDANAVTISVDTFRADVARAAIAAGAHLINDVSAGAHDADMLRTAAALGCTIVLMHMRGDAQSMTSGAHTAYPDGLVATVGRELAARVAAAEAAGVRRWRMVLDPGVGFAKTGAQSVELLRRFGELRAAPGLEGLPWVVGPSRKKFIGTVTGVAEAKQRTWGTAAAVAAAVQQGADVVRVHDVEEMDNVVKMADAIWRA